MGFRRPLAIGIAGAIVALIVAWITISPRHRQAPAAPRSAPPPPRWAAPAADATVDLTRLRQQVPGSAYWRDAAPTTDPAVLARRAEEDRRWNDLYGKVLAGVATDAEIDAYYDHLRRRSEDYLRVAEAALAQPLPERERALFALGARMNRDRLASLPRERAEAIARKRLQDERRARWRQGR